MSGDPPDRRPTSMPHVATSPADLLASSPAAPTSTATGSSSTTRRRSATAASATSPGPRRSATTRPRPRRAQWLVWEASQELGARSASIQALYEARARGEVSGFTVPAINLRAQTFDMARTVYETAEAGGVGRGHPRARPERADLHVPAPDRLRDVASWPVPSRRAGAARSSSRATTTSSTPRSTPPTRRR